MTNIREWREFWGTFRKVTGTLEWRVAVADDMPSIRRLQNISERFMRQPQRSPSLFNLPVLIALVAENRDGKIVDVMYAEAQVEIVKMACTRKGLEESLGIQEELSAYLRFLGFRTAVATTTPELKDKMGGSLAQAGFRCLDRVFSYWARHL